MASSPALESCAAIIRACITTSPSSFSLGEPPRCRKRCAPAATEHPVRDEGPGHGLRRVSAPAAGLRPGMPDPSTRARNSQRVTSWKLDLHFDQDELEHASLEGGAREPRV